VTDALLPIFDHLSYAGLFLILLMCGLGLPLPEDIPLVLAGWMVHRGASMPIMVAVGMLGVLIGDSILWRVGRRYGEAILDHRWVRWLVTPTRLEWAERQFARRGTVLIFLARFMPGARVVFFMTSGIFRVPYLKFLAIDGFAALISVPVWIWLGAKFGRYAERIMGDVKQAQFVVFGIIGAALLVWALWEWRQLRIRKQEELAHALTHPPHPHDPSRLHEPQAGGNGLPVAARVRAPEGSAH